MEIKNYRTILKPVQKLSHSDVWAIKVKKLGQRVDQKYAAAIDKQASANYGNEMTHHIMLSTGST